MPVLGIGLDLLLYCCVSYPGERKTHESPLRRTRGAQPRSGRRKWLLTCGTTSKIDIENITQWSRCWSGNNILD